MPEPLLKVHGLTTTFFTHRGIFEAVRDVSFHIDPGEIVGLVGESGCGKTITAFSVMRLLQNTAKITRGEIYFDGMDLVQLPEKRMQSIRGNRISIVFQEPMTSLNPVMNIGDQVSEGLVIHRGMSKSQARWKAIELLQLVKFPDAEKRVRDFPHHLSGGMRQRVMIAMAIACRPAILIADEPTTALDVTIQAEILDLLVSLRNHFGLSILLITHDFGVIAEVADRVLVMYAGKIIEEAPVRELFENPRHPYSVALLNSILRIDWHAGSPKSLKGVAGNVPDLIHLPPGCSFYDRCPDRMKHCVSVDPPLLQIGSTHTAACHKYEPAGS